MTILTTIGLFIVVMSLAEYWIHRLLMHRPFPWRTRLFVRHHLMQHGQHKNDLNIDLPPCEMILYTLPVWGPMLFFSVTAGFTFLGCAMGYGYLWSKLHRAFHNVEVNWTLLIPWYYDAALRHHQIHHSHPHRNLGTVFIFTDRLFGTRHKGR